MQIVNAHAQETNALVARNWSSVQHVARVQKQNPAHETDLIEVGSVNPNFFAVHKDRGARGEALAKNVTVLTGRFPPLIRYIGLFLSRTGAAKAF